MNHIHPHATTHGLRVRQASFDDLGALAPLFDAYRQFYAQPSDMARARDFLAQRLTHGDSVVLLAERVDGHVVGFTQLYPLFSSVSTARVFILNDLFVAPQARRRGVAAELLAAAATFAKTRGAIRLSLSTVADNHTAQALYQARGWVKDEVFWHYNLSI